MKEKAYKERKRSIFRTIFIPLIGIMVLQSVILYVVAVYGGIEKSLDQNAVDILSEQVANRTNYIETKFNTEWTNLAYYEQEITKQYEEFKKDSNTDYPFLKDKKTQTQFLEGTSDVIVNALRGTKVNGVFLMLNNSKTKETFRSGVDNKIYGLDIRDMDQESTYSGRDDILIERAPSSIIYKVGGSLDSWWEAYYNFSSKEEGSYFYNPIEAAWNNKGAESDDLAYFCGAHSLNDNDKSVISYSIPLTDKNGYPFAVLGVELTEKYIASLLPSDEIGDSGSACYILGTHDDSKMNCTPSVESGALFNRCFSSNEKINCGKSEATGGFSLSARGTDLYGITKPLNVYNNNNPFEKDKPVIMALVDEDTLFAYGNRVKYTLLWITLFSLLLGVAGIYIVSSRFSKPIRGLASKARTMKPEKSMELEHLGITEIDQLVDSIEELSTNVNKEIARTEFFSRMSHDMRTPMNAIISFSSMEMLDGCSEESKLDYFDKIHTSGIYLLGLINEVLDMTKIESNKIDLKEEPKVAKELWNVIIPMVEELANDKGVVFNTNIECDEDLCIMVDSQHLSQIVMNLLSNAVKFTPKDGVVTLTIKIKDNNGKANCHITVSDTGIGMSPEFQEKLYTPFEQEHSEIGGTGLGLSISKQLTELMGGTIKCQSEENKGTTFDVSIPFAISEYQDIINNTEKLSLRNENDHSILEGKRILLCEDHPINVQISTQLLKKKGMIVQVALNGKEGLEAFANSEVGYFDGILMDIRMPVMDGLESARAIRSLDREDSKTIPIIAMTANAFAEDEKNTREAGMNAHLSKPIETDILYNTLKELL